MSFVDPYAWSRRGDVDRRDPTPSAAEAAPVPFWSAVGRNFEDGWETRRRNARYEATDEALWRRHREIERRTGRRWALGESLARVGPGRQERPLDWLFDPEKINAALLGAPGLLSDDAYEAAIEAERRKAPELFQGIPTRGELAAGLDADMRETRRRADEASSQGFGGAVAGFVGQTGAYFADPANAGTAIVTGGWGAGRPLLTRMIAQGAVGGGQEALEIAGRAEEAATYGGPEYTAADAALDVGAGVAGGAGFEAASSGLGWVWRQGARRLGGSADPSERGVGAAIDRLLDDEAAIGDAVDFDGQRAALDRLTPPSPEVDRDLEGLFGPVRSSQPGPARAGVSGSVRSSQPASAEVEYRGRRITQERFDPRTLEVDPSRFQFKAEGDAQGVTARLRGVERWDPTASGKGIVFEDLDGRRFVADGHQRRGLAARLAEQGWDDVFLDGYLFREADGWTPREVRVVAALKNIREGSGTPLDAAKIFRDAPQALRDRSLPVTGEFIQQARALSALSDDAFRAVAAGVVPERLAVALGELAGDRPELHGDLIALLKKADPRGVEGARALVQEALLDDFIKAEGVQLDLFGGLPRESTLIARGRIREAVLAGLRKDARLNGLLVRHADAIEAGGNVLARTGNEQQLAIDRAAGELVSRLALRSGDMGEAFAKAAEAVTLKQATTAEASRGIIARIRAAVKAGEDLSAARAETLTATPPDAAATAAAATFAEPAGPGQRAQLTPKPEEAALEAEGGGLFDDLVEDVDYDRAVSALTPCAPGKGGA